MSVSQYACDTCTNVAKIPQTVLAVGCDMIEAVYRVTANAAAVVTLGLNDSLNREAQEFNCSTLLTRPYTRIVSIVNPYASVGANSSLGIFSQAFARPVFERAHEFAESHDCFSKQIFSRVCFALAGVVAAITRVADLALGIAAAAFSLVPCFARANNINNFAYQHLMATSVISDVCYAVRHIVNPRA